MTQAESKIIHWLKRWRDNVTMTEQIRDKLVFWFKRRPTTY